MDGVCPEVGAERPRAERLGAVDAPGAPGVVRPAWTEASWWEVELSPGVRGLLGLVPGPGLVAALAGLAPGRVCLVDHGVDASVPGGLVPGRSPGWPCACQVVVAAAWQACGSWLATRSAGAVVAAAGSGLVRVDTGGGRVVEDPAREELAYALRWSIPSMGNRIHAARGLVAHPRLVELVGSGAITEWAGRLVAEHVGDLAPEQADRVLAEVVDRVCGRLASGRRAYTSAEVSRVARAARLRHCPRAEAEARVRAFTARRVAVHPAGNGMAVLVADLAEVDARRIHARLTGIAAGLQADPAEDRTRDQLRADILTDLLLTGAPAGVSPTGPGPASGVDPGSGAGVGPGSGAGVGPGPAPVGGPVDAPAAIPVGASAAGASAAGGGPGPAPVEVQVVVSLETLLGLADAPGEVPGLGPVPAEVARVLAADAPWRAWVTSTAGTVTATSSTCYTPSPALARLVRAREPHCRFPGCRRPAIRCDLDHAIPWPRGATTAENIGPLCRRHHNLKSAGLWTLHTHPDTTTWTWRTPSGLTITDGPEPPTG